MVRWQQPHLIEMQAVFTLISHARLPSTVSLADVIRSDTQSQLNEVQMPPQELRDPGWRHPISWPTRVQVAGCKSTGQGPNVPFQPKGKTGHFKDLALITFPCFSILCLFSPHVKLAMLFWKSTYRKIYCIFLQCSEYESYEQWNFTFCGFCCYTFFIAKGSINSVP